MRLRFLALALALTGTASAQPLTPAWGEFVQRPMTVEIERDAITDTVRARAVAHSRDGRLEIGCNADKYQGVQVSFSGREWLIADHYLTKRRTIDHRFDNDRPQRSWWRIEDREAWLRPVTHVGNFIDRVLQSDRLTIRTENLEKREFDQTFSLRGGRAAVGLMLEACRGEQTRRSLARR